MERTGRAAIRLYEQPDRERPGDIVHAFDDSPEVPTHCYARPLGGLANLHGSAFLDEEKPNGTDPPPSSATRSSSPE